jgi:tetratricopeptide (TPR) repeat protein
VTRGYPGLLAAALATAAAPSAARAERPDPGRELAAVEERLATLERPRVEEPPGARASRKSERGLTQARLGDWLHAAVLLQDALEEPAFRGTPDLPEATFWLAESFRHLGHCGAARARYDELLQGSDHRRTEVLVGAMDCAVKSHRLEGMTSLVAEARRASGGTLPPEVAYLAAKAAFQSTGDPQRIAEAQAAFAAVPPPYHLQAAYFLGVLAVQAGDLGGAAERFDRCGQVEVNEPRDREVRDLCRLALGRVLGEAGKLPEAFAAYARLDRASPHFDEALYETAWNLVKQKKYDQALHLATTIADLAPDSPLAPEATILQGHLLLKLGKYAAATEAYNRVINTYAPVRDEIDAILTMHDDPVRYFNDLVGRHGKAFDVASLLPPIAVKWAASQRDVAQVLGLAQALDGGRKEAQEADALADRLETVLGRGGGLDAFPALVAAYAGADAAENVLARAQGLAADRGFAAAARAVPADGRGELEKIHLARAALEVRMEELPGTAEEEMARFARLRGALDRVERMAWQLGLELEGCSTAIAGTELWLEQHRNEISADPEGRQEFTDELRKHRAIVSGYDGDLRGIRQAIARGRDAASGTELLAGEAALRAEHRELMAKEGALLETARAALTPAQAADLDAAAALAGRADELRGRAARLKGGLAAEAAQKAQALRERIGAERQALRTEVAALDGVQGEAKDLVGRIAYRSFSAVRSQFYRLVLKADVGLVDVAWSRKRERLDKIQQLSIQKAAEVQQLDDGFKGLLREVD